MPAAPAAAPAKAHSPHDENSSVRLHITPLRPELLKVYLGPSILPLAQNISYHTVETFPEKGFGYVELPQLEAQKLTKKLNGTTLRGSKVRIEMAKSEKRKTRADTDLAKQSAEARDPLSARRREKSKKELGVLEGVELPDDRKVKRGWTEPQKNKKKDRRRKRKTRTIKKNPINKRIPSTQRIQSCYSRPS